MLRPVLAAVLLLMVPGQAFAQADVATQSQQDPQAAYQELAKSFGKAMNTWMTKREAAIKKAQENPGDSMRAVYRAFVEQRHGEMMAQHPDCAEQINAALAVALKALA